MGIMEEKLAEIRREIEEKIESYKSSRTLYEFRKTMLDNREGRISLLMRGLKDVPKEERPAAGKSINDLKEWALSRFEEMDAKLHAVEIQLREKAEAGADYITTQPVFDPDSLFRFMDAIADLNLPVIAGIWPLTSLRNATFMRNEVPGVTVPDEVMRRMSEPETGEAQMAVGLQIAKEAVERIRSRVAGIQVSAPFGKVQLAFEVMGK